jgi:hypothetical protein
MRLTANSLLRKDELGYVGDEHLCRVLSTAPGVEKFEFRVVGLPREETVVTRSDSRCGFSLLS